MWGSVPPSGQRRATAVLEEDLGLTEFADELRNTHLLLRLHYVYALEHFVLFFAIICLLFSISCVAYGP